MQAHRSPVLYSKCPYQRSKGNLNSGFVFAGANSYKIDKIVEVKDLMEELVRDTKLYFE